LVAHIPWKGHWYGLEGIAKEGHARELGVEMSENLLPTAAGDLICQLCCHAQKGHGRTRFNHVVLIGSSGH